MQADGSKAGSEQVVTLHRPENWAGRVDPGQQAGDQQAGRRTVFGIRALPHHLVQDAGG